MCLKNSFQGTGYDVPLSNGHTNSCKLFFQMKNE